MIDGQLELEIRVIVAQIDQRETVEPEAVGDLQAEGAFVERDRAVLVEDSDHGVNGLGHCHPPICTAACYDCRQRLP